MTFTKPKACFSFLGKCIFDILNDGLFKTTLLSILVVRITQQSATLRDIFACLLVLPFFLFSARAGQLAKKYKEVRLTQNLRLTELLLTLLTGAVFFTESIGLLVLLPIVFGVLCVFFSPIRLALLSNTMQTENLTVENAHIKRTTSLSTIPALLLGVLLPIKVAAIFFAGFAVLSFITAKAFLSPEEKAEEKKEKPTLPSFKETALDMLQSLKLMKKHPLIYRSVLGSTWFWSLGLLILLQIYPLTSGVFNTTRIAVAFLLSLYALGVIVGGSFCSRLLKGLTHTTFVPISTIGMAVCFLVLFLLSSSYPTPEETIGFVAFIAQPRIIAFSLTFFLLAFCCGMYVVPLSALIRTKSPKNRLLTFFVANNIVNALGLILIASFFIGLRSVGFTISQLYLIAGFASLVISIYNCSVLPAALLRSLAQTVLEFFFRVKLEGLQNFDEAGKRVLIIANHTSHLDGLLIAAFMPEKITIVIRQEWADKWFAKFFGLMVDLYPLDFNNPLSLRSLVDLIKKNNRVMIFPERRVSVTGALMKVYEGAGLVAEKANAKILPIRINGAQYSKLSLIKNKVRTHFFPKITMNILPPKTFNIDPTWTSRQRTHEISIQLYDMMVDMLYESSQINENLFVSLLNAAKVHGKNHVIAEDITRKPLKYKTLLLKSYVLGAAYRQVLEGEDKVGILLPNVLANLVSFFALQGIDKTPAMLNFSSGIAQVLSCIKTVQLNTVITSKKFIEGARLEALEAALKEAGVRLIYLEEFAATITLKDKLDGIFSYLIGQRPANEADKTAVVMFTSGSEGMPKAVLLSHKNLQANRYQALSVIALTSADIFFNALPMFHAFGLGVGTLLTTLSGVKTFYYPSPLHYRIVPELVYETNATILCGTDTFFAGYANAAHQYDFFALRYAIVGAEKLKASTAEIWMSKFGIRILEGYGATETSPVISINTPMYIRKNSVGRLFPKIVARLEDVEGIAEGKRLYVSGDNIMQGYIMPDNPGVLLPPKDGWHDTGDIVTIDKDGFIFIQGRAKRFAKIAGEMVSLTALEQALSTLYPKAVQGIVSIPDEKKGEQLVLITTHEEPNAQDIKAHIKKQELNELGSPTKFIVVKEPPVLGSGKFDYIKATKMAEEKFC